MFACHSALQVVNKNNENLKAFCAIGFVQIGVLKCTVYEIVHLGPACSANPINIIMKVWILLRSEGSSGKHS